MSLRCDGWQLGTDLDPVRASVLGLAKQRCHDGDHSGYPGATTRQNDFDRGIQCGNPTNNPSWGTRG